MKKQYWMTISAPAKDKDTADRMAEEMAILFNGDVVQVDREPPQGATIVGDHKEDNL